LAARIRLKRVGAKKNPHYRIVVMHGAKTRDGEAIETLGHYDPRKADPTPVFADPEPVRSLLRRAGIWAKFAEVRNSKRAKAAEPAADGAV
jgi:small subunit ribosomal protein S16